MTSFISIFFVTILDICFLISIWYLIPPRVNKFFNKFHAAFGYIVGFIALMSWCLILTKGCEVLFGFIPESSTSYNEEDSEYVSNRVEYARLVGVLVSFLLAFVFTKYGKYRIREAKKEENTDDFDNI